MCVSVLFACIIFDTMRSHAAVRWCVVVVFVCNAYSVCTWCCALHRMCRMCNAIQCTQSHDNRSSHQWDCWPPPPNTWKRLTTNRLPYTTVAFHRISQTFSEHSAHCCTTMYYILLSQFSSIFGILISECVHTDDYTFNVSDRNWPEWLTFTHIKSMSNATLEIFVRTMETFHYATQ